MERVIKKFWDHSVSPSRWVVKKGEVELFRGTYDDGVLFLKSLDNGGLISFNDDYIPAMQKLRKYCQKGYALERKLRRDIIKLKKELKSEREKASQ
jgi:NADH:ubiquinone oxidoreductase subunit B-like Fe-S oxidoreductase